MIYLIGVDHIVQHINKEASAEKARLVAEFTHHLKEAAKSLRVVLLAEEFSTEALAKNSATSSTAQKVSRELKIQHRFCDPIYKRDTDSASVKIISIEENCIGWIVYGINEMRTSSLFVATIILRVSHPYCVRKDFNQKFIARSGVWASHIARFSIG